MTPETMCCDVQGDVFLHHVERSRVHMSSYSILKKEAKTLPFFFRILTKLSANIIIFTLNMNKREFTAN